MTADVQRDPTVCLCDGKPEPHGYGEPGCLDAADVQRELAEAHLPEVVSRWAAEGFRDIGGLSARVLEARLIERLLPTVQALIADAEKRAAAAARDHGRMVGAYETFASLASNLRHGTTFTAEDMDRLAAEYRTAAALDPAGAASGETTHIHGAWCHPSAEGCPDDLR